MAKFCTNCGSPLEEGQTTCNSCGNVIGTKTANQSTVTPTKTTAAPGAKSKLAAGLLGIFLGSLGVHNFYLGYTGKAIAQLLITVLTCGLGAGISSIWGLIEGILILTGSIAVDGQGNPLAD